MSKLPDVVLDTTLAELYKEAHPDYAEKNIGLILCGVNSAIELHPGFPRNVKYIYQDTPYNSLPRQQLTNDNNELQHSLALKYLSLIPQRDAFISGDTNVVLFNVDQSPEQIEHDKTEAERTIEVLSQKQKPSLIFCDGPNSIPVEQHNIDVLACKLVLDDLEQYPAACDLDTLYFLNSKEALANSGLPTPYCTIIRLDGHRPAVQTCCNACSTEQSLFVPQSCTGESSKWLEESVARVVSAVRTHKLPFVFKNQQTFGGAGTYVINDEQARSEMVEHLTSGDVLQRLFSQVNKNNEHLKPGTVLLSEMVSSIAGDYGLTFFVKSEDHTPIFLAVSEQMIDANSAWIGSTINYDKQRMLYEKFKPIMHKIAAWLGSYGYFGPAGADILVTKADNEAEKDSSEVFQIVDLNVRTSGSICLPLLRSHFTSRGFSCASSFSITVKSSRNQFIQEWREDFEAGKMCILSWYEDKGSEFSVGDVAVAGEDEDRLQKEIQKIKNNSHEITF